MRIGVLEDDATQIALYKLWLGTTQHQPVYYGTVADFMAALRTEKFDLLLIDRQLPDGNGESVLKWVRENLGWDLPVIFVTANDHESDIVSALRAGADDYVVKPFGTRELLARIRALLRRTGQGAAPKLGFADVEVDMEQRLVRRAGAELRLTKAEFNLLAFFIQNPGRALSRDVILNSVWGYASFPNTRTVDAHVVRLRQKLEPDPETPRYFLTMHGVGYRFLP